MQVFLSQPSSAIHAISRIPRQLPNSVRSGHVPQVRFYSDSRTQSLINELIIKHASFFVLIRYTTSLIFRPDDVSKVPLQAYQSLLIIVLYLLISLVIDGEIDFL